MSTKTLVLLVIGFGCGFLVYHHFQMQRELRLALVGVENRLTVVEAKLEKKLGKLEWVKALPKLLPFLLSLFK